MNDFTDHDLVMMLSASPGCSLAKTPEKDNWVDEAGHLPNYICNIAKEIAKGGKSTSSAIAIAVSRVKVWAAGGDKVSAATQAKAAKALAEWNALKAKAKGKKLVKATSVMHGDYLMFTNVGSFNTDMVRSAWDRVVQTKRKEAREAARAAGKSAEYEDLTEVAPYSYIRELWTDHIIITFDSYSGDRTEQNFASVPYSVDGDTVSFGEPTEVKLKYIEVQDDELSQEELEDLLGLSANTPLERIIALSNIR